MAFEKKVLAVVSQVMAAKSFAAEFVNGTLFVQCEVADAVKIETALLKALPCGIILSRIDGESAYDFV